MRLRYLTPALLVALIGYAIWRYLGAIMYAGIVWGAWRMLRARTAPRYMRRKTRRVNIAGWADALTGVVIAWNTRGMSTSKREPVEPGPKPVYSLRPARPWWSARSRAGSWSRTTDRRSRRGA